MRFLYCPVTELWGRGERARAGGRKPGASGRGAREANPPRVAKAVKRSETQVAKSAGLPPGKAAIVHRVPVPETDTGGRGEDPKADGRSIAKELGKMTP